MLINKYVLIVVLISFGCLFNASAQRLGFTYQAVAIDASKSQSFGRDSQGEILANKDVALRFSILEGSEEGAMVYQESHETTTDIFGIFRLIIGRGVNLLGNSLEDLAWGEVAYFLQVEINLGQGLVFMGIEELLGSPYALNSNIQLLELNGNELSISKGNTVTLQDNDPTNELLQTIAIAGSTLIITDAGGDKSVELSGLISADNSSTNELQTIAKTGNTVTLSNSGGSFTDEVNDADFDPANEIQAISTDGTAGNISLSSGATLGLNVNDADFDPANEIQTIAKTGSTVTLSNSGGSFTDEVNDADADATNELQTILKSGNTVTLSNSGGSFIDDVNDADFDPTNEIQTISTDGTAGNIALTGGATLALNVNDADADATNELQTISKAGNTITLSNSGGSFIDDVNDADFDPANEIQDLQLVGNNLIITNNGTATTIDLSPYSDGAFSTTSNVTSNAPGAYTTDDFVVGSPQLDDDGDANHDRRMFFDKSKAAFRAGFVTGTEWDDANRGLYSVAMGRNTIASGDVSTAMGFHTTASGINSTAMGSGSIASGETSTAMGSVSIASGETSTAMGFQTTASGDVSTAMGFHTTASGNYSTATGFGTTASGLISTAMGMGTTASGSSSTAMGSGTTASGVASTSMGLGTFSRSYAEISIGANNTDYTPNSVNSFNAADRLFVIGNGTTTGARSDALIIYKSGNAILNGMLTIDGDNAGAGAAYTLPAQDGTANQIMATDGAGTLNWVAGSGGAFTTTTNVTSNAPGAYTTDDFVVGSPQLDDDGDANHDRRIFFDKSKAAFRTGMAMGTEWDDANRGLYSVAMGQNTTASSVASTAMGFRTIALGNYSTAMGVATAASGINSTAMGSGSIASGETSTAMGSGSIASGLISTAMGFQTTASGNYSTAMGLNTIASGLISTAMGIGTTASGGTSTAMGQNTTASGATSTAIGFGTDASGESSTAIGFGTDASGNYSTAMGDRTTSRSYAETSIGTYNTDYTPNSTIGFNAADRLFVVGNGTGGARSDALIIYKNGDATLNGLLTIDGDNAGAGAAYTLPAQDGTANQIIATDGAGSLNWIAPPSFTTTSNVTSNSPGNYATDDFVFGSPQLDNDGNNNHYFRMFFDKSKAAFRAGLGFNTYWDDANRGHSSVAMGVNGIASAYSSTALGLHTIASGRASISMGQSSIASGETSSALGSLTIASGKQSTAMGGGTTASGVASTSMGLGTFSRSFAETTIGLYNTDYTPNLTSGFNAADRLFVVGNGTNNMNRSDALIIYKNGDGTLAGTLTQLSDARLKKNIAPLHGSLSNLNKLQGVHYKWNAVKPHDMESLQTGLIAQEVEKILPELVNEASDGYKSVNYIGLIPHLIEAVKELEAKNTLLEQEGNKKIKSLEERLLRLEKLIEGK